MTMFEVDEAARIISGSADTDANIIFGAVIRSDLADQIRITVVATGFDETRARIAQFATPQVQPPIQGVVSEPLLEKDKDDDEKQFEDDDLPPDEGERDDQASMRCFE